MDDTRSQDHYSCEKCIIFPLLENTLKQKLHIIIANFKYHKNKLNHLMKVSKRLYYNN